MIKMIKGNIGRFLDHILLRLYEFLFRISILQCRMSMTVQSIFLGLERQGIDSVILSTTSKNATIAYRTLDGQLLNQFISYW